MNIRHFEFHLHSTSCLECWCWCNCCICWLSFHSDCWNDSLRYCRTWFFCFWITWYLVGFSSTVRTFNNNNRQVRLVFVCQIDCSNGFVCLFEFRNDLPLKLVAVNRHRYAVALWAVHLNGQRVAWDLIGWKNGRWQNHCPRLMWMASVMMHTAVVCRWYNFVALAVDVQHSLSAMNVPFVSYDQHLHIRHSIASMTVYVHFHAVLVLDAQALVIAHVAAAAWVVYDCSVWPFWMSVCLKMVEMKKKEENHRINANIVLSIC